MVVGRADEKQLDLAAAFLAHQQAGREDPGIVEHQHVAGLQVAAQLVEARMLDRAGLAVDHLQPRLVAARQRLLRNQLGRQIVVEFA